jgi:hypothetical protein
MPINRRDLISLAPVLGASSAVGALTLLTSCGSSGVQSQEAKSVPDADQQAAYDFWTKDIRDPESVSKKGVGGTAAPRASIVYFDPDNGFLAGSDIANGDKDLADKGDLDIIVNVDHIRPSTADQTRFANLEGGSLRIDVQQTAPLPTLAERLAWTAVAGFLPENKKLPALKEMTFDPGATWGKLQTVPLPGGGGRWTWNFFLQRKQSRWMQIFDVIRRNKNLLIPIFGLGLPAIAITALNTVDSIVGELTKDERTDWLFQSPDSYFYATKDARDSFAGTKLRLRGDKEGKGMYVVLPSDQLSNFGKQAKDLVVKDGLIVPKNTSGLDIEAAAKTTIPEITYLTVGLKSALRPVKA